MLALPPFVGLPQSPLQFSFLLSPFFFLLSFPFFLLAVKSLLFVCHARPFAAESSLNEPTEEDEEDEEDEEVRQKRERKEVS